MARETPSPSAAAAAAPGAELGIDAERRESPLFQMQEHGEGTDQRVLGRATVEW